MSTLARIGVGIAGAATAVAILAGPTIALAEPTEPVTTPVVGSNGKDWTAPGRVGHLGGG